jgi:hypothetical protein
MFKKLIKLIKGLFVNKEMELLKAQLAAATAELERVNSLRTVKTDTKKDDSEYETKNNQYEDMDWKELTRNHKEVVDKWLEEIQSSIISRGYKAIPEILSEYRTEMIQHFVLTQKISLGEYVPELDNLDSLSRDKLIEMAVELNQLSYEKRMEEQGKASVTKAQKALLIKYGVKDMPKNRFEASRLIEKILKDNGIDTSKPYSTDATEAQINRIKKLSEMLGKEIAITEIKTKSEASKLINDLQKELESKPELIPAITEKQYETIAKLIRQLGKRMTEKRKTEYKALNSFEASKVIAELSKEYNEKHPEATEGQVQYIITLCSLMNLPYNVDEIKALTKIEATKKLDKLNRKYLYILTRKVSPSMTKEEIAKMDYNTVKALISQIKEENKTKDYKDFPEERA